MTNATIITPSFAIIMMTLICVAMIATSIITARADRRVSLFELMGHVVNTWAKDMIVAAQKAAAIEEEAYISRGTVRATRFDFMTEEEQVEYGVQQLAGKYQVPMI